MAENEGKGKPEAAQAQGNSRLEEAKAAIESLRPNFQKVMAGRHPDMERGFEVGADEACKFIMNLMIGNLALQSNAMATTLNTALASQQLGADMMRLIVIENANLAAKSVLNPQFLGMDEELLALVKLYGVDAVKSACTELAAQAATK